MTVIKDGGSGTTAKVDSEGNLRTVAITQSEIEHVSETEELAFSWVSGTWNPEAADTILLVKNTSSDETLHIKSIWMSTDADTLAQIHIPTSDVTVAGDTVIVGTNLNAASTKVADASAATNETGNAQGNIIWEQEIFALNGPTVVDFDGAIVLGQNQSIAVDYVSATAVVGVTIIGYYE